jgi:hypothetical protein
MAIRSFYRVMLFSGVVVRSDVVFTEDSVCPPALLAIFGHSIHIMDVSENG